MDIEPVYFLAAHEPYQLASDTQPVDCLLVDARTLLHPSLPQPDAGRMYRCAVEAPARVPEEIVPLSTMTFELDGGRLWCEVADWETVVDRLVELTQSNGCDAMRFGLTGPQQIMLANGPFTTNDVHYVGGGSEIFTPFDRADVLSELSGHIRRFVADGGPFWPGDNLLAPPAEPSAMPYQPHSKEDALRGRSAGVSDHAGGGSLASPRPV